MNLAPISEPLPGGRTSGDIPSAAEQALLRLQRSRACLRRALVSAPEGSPMASGQPPSGAGELLNTLRGNPAARVFLDAVSSWWSLQPVGNVLKLAAAAATTLLKPVAQRRPLVLILGALVLGGVVIWSKPWRWLVRPAALSLWLPRVVAGVAAQIPLSAWSELLHSTHTQSAQRNPASPAERGTEPAPHDPSNPG